MRESPEDAATNAAFIFIFDRRRSLMRPFSTSHMSQQSRCSAVFDRAGCNERNDLHTHCKLVELFITQRAKAASMHTRETYKCNCVCVVVHGPYCPQRMANAVRSNEFGGIHMGILLLSGKQQRDATRSINRSAAKRSRTSCKDCRVFMRTPNRIGSESFHKTTQTTAFVVPASEHRASNIERVVQIMMDTLIG